MSDLLTVPEVAAELRVGVSTVYRALEEGRMPGTKPLGRWRIDRAELDEWRREQRPLPRPRCADPMPRPRRQSASRFREKVVELDSRRRVA
jgi:excisionase family DNA binding protein